MLAPVASVVSMARLNIITQGFLMTDELNMHFSSVFTREDTSSLPVPETKLNGSEGERLGQLTPEV